jgi:hypothetical protein
MAPCCFYRTEMDRRRSEVHDNGEGSGTIRLRDTKMATLVGRRNVPGVDRSFGVEIANEPPSPPRQHSKWIVEVQNMDFEVLHAVGDRELIAIPDAMSRDFVDGQVLCHRYLEVVAEIDDDTAEMMRHEDAAATMRCAQQEEFRP